jgi:hypothetical protein
MKIYMSDSYSEVSWIDISGSPERNPPLLPYDEISALPQVVFWGFVLALIFIMVMLITCLNLLYGE